MYVPEKYYVGFQIQGTDSIVGFFTPDDGDDKSKKRKKTVNSWSDPKLKNNATTFNNTPRTGFRIVDTTRRYHNNNVLFRILHPEVGAEFEISAENLNNLHQQCIIEYGEIKTELLFVRDEKTNILVVKDSEEHKKALQDMEEEKAKKAAISTINKKDIVVGSVLDIPYSSNVIYLGKHKVSYIHHKEDSKNRYSKSYQVLNGEEKFLVFLEKGATKNNLILRKSWPKIEKLHNEVQNVDIEKSLELVDLLYCGSYDIIRVFHVALDEVLNPQDFEITFDPRPNCNMSNIGNWNDSMSFYYGLLPDGTFYHAEPRHIFTGSSYGLGVLYDETYKAQGLDIVVSRNVYQRCSIHGSAIQVTDPNTFFYKLRITKKKEQE